jgi:capsular exopolysaccharide synthesis family protein
LPVKDDVATHAPALDADARVRLAALTRDVHAARQMFDIFLASHNAVDAPPATALALGARLISPAIIPVHASWPPLRLWLYTAAGGSLLVLCALALMLGNATRTFRSAREAEEHTGLPCHALIPTVPMDDATGAPVADAILSPAARHAAESLRALRAMTGLRAPDGTERPRVLALTSSYPGEGKSTLAAWLARTAAQSGERVIIVDCDMRRPALHRAFACVRDKTLPDYLDGNARLEDIVNTSDAGGVHMIFAGAVPARALELLSGERLHRLIAALRKTYDLVILDCPACMAVTDPLILARQADLTLYNVIWNETPRTVLDTALRLFDTRDRARMALVLNKVDMHGFAAYGYGDAPADYIPTAAAA